MVINRLIALVVAKIGTRKNRVGMIGSFARVSAQPNAASATADTMKRPTTSALPQA